MPSDRESKERRQAYYDPKTLNRWRSNADPDLWERFLGSAGYVSGGAITDNEDGTIDVAAGVGFFRTSDSSIATLELMRWPASAGLTIATDTIRWVGVEYNAGSPQVVIRTSDDFDGNTDWPLAQIANEGDELHIDIHRTHGTDTPQRLADYLEHTYHIQRADADGGLILGELGTRNPTVTEGLLFNKLHRFPIAALDLSGADTMDRYYRDSPSGWVKEAGESQWPNTQYDDGSGTLATMIANRWAALYFYIESDGQLVMMYGQAQYVTEAAAEADAPPSTVPDRIATHALLIGRMIFQKSAATATVESVFAVVFASAGVTSHADLANVTSDQHHAESHNIVSHSDITAKTGGGTTVVMNDGPYLTRIKDSSGNTVLDFGSQASAVNNLQLINAAAGNPVILKTLGSDADIGLIIGSKGLGDVTLRIDTLEALVLSGVSSAVNELTITNAATGDPVLLNATGDDDDISIVISSKGSGAVSIPGLGDGGVTSYDLKVGNTTTPDYGMIQMGHSVIGRTSFHVSLINLDGAMLYRNTGGPVNGSKIEHIFTESTGNTCRFALPKSGVGYATYNPRSMINAGPAPADTDFVDVAYWQGQGIFHNLACDTAGSGADLGVQNDLEVEGIIYVDTIVESTTGVGVTVDGRDIGADGALLDTALQNVVEDVTPQLGGNLDLNQHNLSSTDDLAVQLAGVVDRTLSLSNPSTGVCHLDVQGNILVGGTVDGRDVAADGALLDTALQDVADDTSPALGGNLDVGAFYVDWTEISAPANPGANVARMYCRDDTGTTKLFYRDSAGAETELGGGTGDPDQNLWLTIAADSGGPVSANTTTDTLALTGGTGIDTSISGDAVTFAIDSTVVTLTGTQTLTNKTLTAPKIGSIADAASATIFDFSADASPVDRIQALASSTTSKRVWFAATGSDADIEFRIVSKGDYPVVLQGKSSLDVLKAYGVASAVNHLRVTNAIAASAVAIVAASDSESDVDLSVSPLGAGDLILDGQKWPQSGVANGYLTSDGTDSAWTALDISDDTSPALGGNLAVGGNYLDWTEMSTPANPAANVARMYCRDASGRTGLFYRDSAGLETPIGVEAKYRTGEGLIHIHVPDSGDFFEMRFVGTYPKTVKKVWAATDTGTVTFQVSKLAFGSPGSGGTTMLSSSMVADSSGVSTTSFSGTDNEVGAEMWIAIDGSATSLSPQHVWIAIELEVD